MAARGEDDAMVGRSGGQEAQTQGGSRSGRQAARFGRRTFKTVDRDSCMRGGSFELELKTRE